MITPRGLFWADLSVSGPESFPKGQKGNNKITKRPKTKTKKPKTKFDILVMGFGLSASVSNFVFGAVGFF